MEPEGITNAWTRKVFSTSAMRTATPMRSGISLTAPRLRRRLTLRCSLRRSARDLPPDGGPVRREPVGSRFSVGLLGAPRGLPRLPIGALGPAGTTRALDLTGTTRAPGPACATGG